ncbi:MAG: hypothetical protein ACRC0X_09410 [Brevinema sp.]
MIVEIQEVLKEVLLQQENITENIIFLEEMEESEFNTAPWVSILPETANIELAYQSSVGTIQKNEKTYNIQQKYKIVQPFMLRAVFGDKKELDHITDRFLVDLPKSIIVGEVVIEIQPLEIERIFAKGLLDVNATIIKIVTEYPVVKLIEIDKISGIDIDVR